MLSTRVIRLLILIRASGRLHLQSTTALFESLILTILLLRGAEVAPVFQ